jgi:hypothetical protein
MPIPELEPKDLVTERHDTREWQSMSPGEEQAWLLNQALDCKREILTLPMPDPNDDSIEAHRLRLLILAAADSTTCKQTSSSRPPPMMTWKKIFEERRAAAELEISPPSARTGTNTATARHPSRTDLTPIHRMTHFIRGMRVCIRAKSGKGR